MRRPTHHYTFGYNNIKIPQHHHIPSKKSHKPRANFFAILTAVANVLLSKQDHKVDR